MSEEPKEENKGLISWFISLFTGEENFNSGGRVGYQTGGISVGGLPGFAISTGLNLLAIAFINGLM